MNEPNERPRITATDLAERLALKARYESARLDAEFIERSQEIKEAGEFLGLAEEHCLKRFDIWALGAAPLAQSENWEVHPDYLGALNSIKERVRCELSSWAQWMSSEWQAELLQRVTPRLDARIKSWWATAGLALVERNPLGNPIVVPNDWKSGLPGLPVFAEPRQDESGGADPLIQNYRSFVAMKELHRDRIIIAEDSFRRLVVETLGQPEDEITDEQWLEPRLKLMKEYGAVEFVLGESRPDARPIQPLREILPHAVQQPAGQVVLASDPHGEGNLGPAVEGAFGTMARRLEAVVCNAESLSAMESGKNPKGDPLPVANLNCAIHPKDHTKNRRTGRPQGRAITGSKLKEFRGRCNLGQVEFADKCGVSKATIQRAESGKPIDQGCLGEIAKTLSMLLETTVKIADLT